MIVWTCSLLLVSTLLIILSGCSKKDSNAPRAVAVEAVNMNVLYLGIENPIKIAVSGIPASEVEVAIDNGTIKGGNGDYFVTPKMDGVAKMTISSKGNEIRVAEFSIRHIPDPLLGAKGITGRNVDKDALIASGELEVRMPEWFCYNINFSISSFSLIATQKGYTKELKTTDHLFTEDMKKLISKLKTGQKVIFCDIKTIGPDGIEHENNDLIYQLN